jgi:glycerol-3-phosphate dehydrogenase
LIPDTPLEYTIRSFAALRPNPVIAECDVSGKVTLSERSINDFNIGSPEGHPLFIDLAGIKTPGLTCANEIGTYVTELLRERLPEHQGNVVENSAYRPIRRIEPRFSRLTQEERKTLTGSQRIICRCCEVTEDEIRKAIRRTAGATTVDGVKRRTGTCMGRCQGGFCTQSIIEILAEELGVGVSDIRKDSGGSSILTSSIGFEPSYASGEPSSTGLDPSYTSGDPS